MIAHWPLFEMTSKSRNKALLNSVLTHDYEVDGKKRTDFDGEVLIFKIYLSGQNEVATNIDMNGYFSETPFEKYETTGDYMNSTEHTYNNEVLLLPMFTFQVAKVFKTVTKKNIRLDKINTVRSFITTITLAEIPYFHQLQIRPIHESQVIWFDVYPPGKDYENVSKWVD